MEALEYLKAKARMVNNCKISCRECPLSNFNSSKNIDCVTLEANYPEETIAIIEKWSKENPIKTYESVVLEKFPKAFSNGSLGCVRTIFGKDTSIDCMNISCSECWNQEYKED